MYILFVLGLWINQVSGQELEPRSYAALPTNLNALAIVAGISNGNVLTEPSLPINNLDVTLYSGGLGYVRTFGIGDKLARISASLPFATISGSAQLNGRDTAASRFGWGDARIRFGINLIGSPALNKKQFASYTQKTVVGISLVTSMPTGTYYPSKLINMGTNRWGFKPEIGISQRVGRLYLEAYVGTWFYTHNTNYLDGKVLSQNPLGSFQAHVCYYFKNKMWISADGNWFSGGEVRVNGNVSGADFDNWRGGGAWSVPVAGGQSIKFQFHSGVFTNRGYNYNSYSLAYQYIFF
ncbi:transporter [Mucilaginibacter sp. R11]|uniref:Transporter n=1 Tax=Mucilaginibacter agri TaxID=2695265 RepID=A0A966DXA4_9SPHI|nr:transporter [Mucilaginibacter agri]